MFGGMMPGGMPGGGGPAPLLQMKAGKMNREGTTVTADTRKGLLVLKKSEDGLMHLIWKDRNGAVVDDLIVFEGDATIRQLDECKDGFAMLLEFSQTARKLFFYSQEARKKGLGWGADDITKEKELVEKANQILTGRSAAAAPSAAPGALGMTHSEIMAMLAGNHPGAPGGAAAATGAAPAAAPAAAAPAAAAGGGLDVSAALGALGGGAAAPAAPAPAAAPSAPFSADNIASILGNIPAAPAAPAAGGAGAPFSADSIASILGNIGGAPAGPPLGVGDVLQSAAPAIDPTMEAALNEHLPQGGSVAESAQETLSTPQMAQVRARTRPTPPQRCEGAATPPRAPAILPPSSLPSPCPSSPLLSASGRRVAAFRVRWPHTLAARAARCCWLRSQGGGSLHRGALPWRSRRPHP
jgi:hypothetical protein